MAMTLAATRDVRTHAQQHLEQLDGGAAIAAAARPLQPRQAFVIAGDAAFDGVDDLLPISNARTLGSERNSRALGGGRRLNAISRARSLEDRRPRGVAGLRLALAPGGDFDQAPVPSAAHPRFSRSQRFGSGRYVSCEVKIFISSSTQSERPRLARSADRAR